MSYIKRDAFEKQLTYHGYWFLETNFFFKFVDACMSRRRCSKTENMIFPWWKFPREMFKIRTNGNIWGEHARSFAYTYLLLNAIFSSDYLKMNTAFTLFSPKSQYNHSIISVAGYIMLILQKVMRKHCCC